MSVSDAWLIFGFCEIRSPGKLIARNPANFVAIASCFLGAFPEGEPYQHQSDRRGEK
jgi:hypothetical protein